MEASFPTDRLRSFGRRRTKRLQGLRAERLEALAELRVSLVRHSDPLQSDPLPNPPPEGGGDSAFPLSLQGEGRGEGSLVNHPLKTHCYEINPASLFPLPPQEIWLEIGFGGGEHLAAQAARHPQIGFIGCEPFMDGISKLIAEIQEKNLQNVRIHAEDARSLLERLPEASVARVFILFPDPWPKQRHHKRRLVNPALLDVLARVMKPGGLLCLATDHAGYAEWMLLHLLADARFRWTATTPEDFTAPPPGWVETRYQQKAAEQGHVACFLLFEKL